MFCSEHCCLNCYRCGSGGFRLVPVKKQVEEKKEEPATDTEQQDAE